MVRRLVAPEIKMVGSRICYKFSKILMFIICEKYKISDVGNRMTFLFGVIGKYRFFRIRLQNIKLLITDIHDACTSIVC